MIDVFEIRNTHLQARIKRKGAELCSVISVDSGQEFIWQAGEIWPRHAPNLFPFVGSLLDHEYIFHGTKYPMTHHGFARDYNFDLLHQSEHSISFVFQSNNETLRIYPFSFTLIIRYTLLNDVLEQSFRLINDSDEKMYASFGGHPAFSIEDPNEYIIEFSSKEQIASNHLTGPYIDSESVAVIKDQKIILSNNTFNEDALIFQGLKSDYVSLKHLHSRHCIKMKIKDWPYLGIWAKPGAPFVCLEPWQGLADFIGHNKHLTEKKGILCLEPKEEIGKSFSMQFNTY